MPFRSILFDEIEIGPDVDSHRPPDCFVDLHLDQIVAAVTAGRDEYNLKPFFYIPLRHVSSVHYRQEILRDFESQSLLVHIQSFAQRMRAVRESLVQAEKLYYKYQKQSWFLSAADIYCGAVRRLSRDLTITGLRSRGFSELLAYVNGYIGSGEFTLLAAETEKLRIDLSQINYSFHIEGSRVMVGRYELQPDYGAEVLHTFEKFKQGAPKDYLFEVSSSLEMNHVEAAILDRVALLFPETFTSLEEYFILASCGRNETNRRALLSYRTRLRNLRGLCVFHCGVCAAAWRADSCRESAQPFEPRSVCHFPTRQAGPVRGLCLGVSFQCRELPGGTLSSLPGFFHAKARYSGSHTFACGIGAIGPDPGTHCKR
jgi:hypothetical protein